MAGAALISGDSGGFGRALAAMLGHEAPRSPSSASADKARRGGFVVTRAVAKERA